MWSQQQRLVVFSFLFVLCGMTTKMLWVSAADVATSASVVVGGVDNPNNNHLAWQGAWHFEPSWFAQQHPWLPKFVASKALSSTLLLDQDGYHQLDNEGKPLKQKRPLRIVSLSPERAHLVRTEGKRKEVEFHLEKRQDNHVYYCEGSSAYRLLRPKTFAQEVPPDVEKEREELSVAAWA